MSIIQGYVTPAKAAEILKKSYASVCRYIEKGQLEAIEDRGRKYISIHSVENFVEPPKGNPNLRKRKASKVSR